MRKLLLVLTILFIVSCEKSVSITQHFDGKDVGIYKFKVITCVFMHGGEAYPEKYEAVVYAMEGEVVSVASNERVKAERFAEYLKFSNKILE